MLVTTLTRNSLSVFIQHKLICLYQSHNLVLNIGLPGEERQISDYVKPSIGILIMFQLIHYGHYLKKNNLLDVLTDAQFIFSSHDGH